LGWNSQIAPPPYLGGYLLGQILGLDDGLPDRPVELELVEQAGQVFT
jgi:hypothetical protein